MLYITVQTEDLFNEATGEFISVKPTRLQLEHSLVSVSKWEAKHHKSFLKNIEELTPEELLSYIECMNMTQNVNPDVFKALSAQNLQEIMAYINDPMTATVINDRHPNRPMKDEAITSEVIYYWMISQEIPVEFQKWHLNRLMTLIRVCAIKNAPSKKMSKADAAAHMRAQKARARARRRH